MPQGDPPTSAEAKSPRALLVEWANDQDNWVRAIVAEVIDTRRGITDERLEYFYTMLLVEKELREGTKPSTPALHWIQAADEKLELLRLISLSDLAGVNAFRPARRLRSGLPPVPWTS